MKTFEDYFVTKIHKLELENKSLKSQNSVLRKKMELDSNNKSIKDYKSDYPEIGCVYQIEAMSSYYYEEMTLEELENLIKSDKDILDIEINRYGTSKNMVRRYGYNYVLDTEIEKIYLKINVFDKRTSINTFIVDNETTFIDMNKATEELIRLSKVEIQKQIDKIKKEQE